MSAVIHTANGDLGNAFDNFSVDWLKDDTQTFKENKIKNRKRLRSVKNDQPIANRNISSIVSKIRDEGSAFSYANTGVEKKIKKHVSSGHNEKVQAKSVMPFSENCEDDIVSLSLKSNTSDRVSAVKEKNQSQGKDRPSFSAVCDQEIELDTEINSAGYKRPEDSARTKNSQSIKKQFVLICIASVVVMIFVYMSYQFKLQSDEMKQTLLMYKQAMNEEQTKPLEKEQLAQLSVKSPLPVSRYSVKARDAIEGVNISSLKNNIVRTDSQIDNAGVANKVDEKTAALVNNADKKKMTPTTLSEPFAKSQVKTRTVLESSIVEKPTVKTYIAADKPIMFTVNLASFSDRKKAYGQLSTFKSFGVTPAVEKAVVGDKVIYRLCVEGFSSREEASWYISRLNKKLAVNAWVRQG